MILSYDSSQKLVYGVIVALLVFLLWNNLDTRTESFAGGFLKIEEHLNEPIHMLAFMASDSGMKRIYIGGSKKYANRLDDVHYMTYHDCSYNISKENLTTEFKSYSLKVKKIDVKKPELGYTMFVLNKQVMVDEKGLLFVKQANTKIDHAGVPLAMDILPDVQFDKGGYKMKLIGTDSYFVITVDDDSGFGIVGFYGKASTGMVVYFTVIKEDMVSDTRFCE